VICAEGKDIHRRPRHAEFFAPTPRSETSGRQRRRIRPAEALQEADRHRGPGHRFTIGIELMLAGDIVVAAETAGSAKWKPNAALRRSAARISVPVAHGWGKRDVSPVFCATNSRRRALRRSGWFRGGAGGATGGARDGACRIIAQNAPLGIQVTKKRPCNISSTANAAIAHIPKVTRARAEQRRRARRHSILHRARAAVFQGR
jgi:hypothetical protein